MLLTAAAISALLVVAVAAALWLAHPSGGVQSENIPPPPDGYFSLVPVGRFAALPDDSAAAAMVRRSTWEPRPGNKGYNQVAPARLRLRPVRVAARAYDPRWNRYVLHRVTGHFTGTTDEIFQWAAVKWGLPDNLLRSIAYMESDWRQRNLGDYVDELAECPPGYDSVPCPVTFGIVGTKSTSWPGVYPWNHRSTAAAVDVLGGWLRGCYEGWAWWLRQHGNTSRGSYHAGDVWGCAGAWYSGDWHDGPAGAPGGEHYGRRAQYWARDRPWLRPQF